MNLEVLSVTNIKSQKPWKNICWLGKDKHDVFVYDCNRIGLLQLPSGKVKKKICDVHQFKENIARMSPSRNGVYMVGLYCDGNLFVWNKSDGTLTTVIGLKEFCLKKTEHSYYALPRLFVSNDGCHIILVFEFNKVYIWERTSDTKDEQCGKWIYVSEASDIILPSPQCKEADIMFGFNCADDINSSSMLGSFMFNMKGFLIVSSVFILPSRIGDFKCNWNMIKISHEDIDPCFRSVRHRYAYVSSYSNDNKIICIAANQADSSVTKLLFVSPETESVVVTNMKGCGAKSEQFQNERHFWIRSLAWTADDMYVVAMNGQGSVCVLTRLGQLLTISTQGCSFEKRANLFLNLHPLIIVSPNKKVALDENRGTESESSLVDRMRQCFSVNTHPNSPVIVCTDGYMVSCLQLPIDRVGQIRCVKSILHSVYSDLISLEQHCDRNKSVASVPTTLLFTAVNSGGKIQREKIDGTTENDALDSTQETVSSFSLTGRFLDITGAAESGKIEFGDESHLHDSKSVRWKDHIYDIYQNILCTWGILVSTKITIKGGVRNLIDLLVMAVVRFSSAVLSSRIEDCTVQNLLTSTERDDASLEIIFRLLTKMFSMLKFDSFFRNVMQASFTLVKKVFERMFNCNHVRKDEVTLLGAFDKMIQFLQDAEVMLDEAYTSSSPFIEQIHRFDRSIQPIRRSLCPTWKLLYRKAVKVYNRMNRHHHLTEEAFSAVCFLQRKLSSLGVSNSELVDAKRCSVSEKHVVPFLFGNKEESISLLFDDVDSSIAELFKTGVEPDELCFKLHALMYALLLESQLGKVLDLMDMAVCYDANHFPSATSDNYDSDFIASLSRIQGLQFKSVRRVMRSFARFLAMYFTDRQLFVYPPHAAVPLKPLIGLPEEEVEPRKLKIERRSIMTSLTTECLGETVTPNSIVELLMLTGLHQEAVWFTNQLGDWKTTLLLSLTLKWRKKSLPTYLKPSSILNQKIYSMCCLEYGDRNRLIFPSELSIGVQNFTKQHASNLQDMFTASVLLKLDVVPELLTKLVKHLTVSVTELPLVVRTDFYLPAPPLFCPQLNLSRGACKNEENIRKKIYSLTETISVAFGVSRLALPSAVWYIKELQSSWRSYVASEPNDEPTLDDILCNLEDFQGSGPPCCAIEDHQDDLSVRTVLSVFRTFCFFHWLMHARDKLSLCLRKFHQSLLKETEQSKRKAAAAADGIYWARQMFYLCGETNWRSELTHLMMTFITELPSTAHSVYLISYCFPNVDQLKPDLMVKFSSIRSSWSKISFRSSDGTKSFVDLLRDMCAERREENQSLERGFGPLNFCVDCDATVVGKRRVGNRVCELETEYYRLLSLLIDVCVVKEYEESGDARSACLPSLKIFGCAHEDDNLKNILAGVLSDGNSRHNSLQSPGIQKMPKSLLRSRSIGQLSACYSRSGEIHNNEESVKKCRSHDPLQKNRNKRVKFNNDFSTLRCDHGKRELKRWVSSVEMQSVSSRNISSDSLFESQSLPDLHVDSKLGENPVFSSLSINANEIESLPTATIPVLLTRLGSENRSVVALLAWFHQFCRRNHGELPIQNRSIFRCRINVTVPQIMTAMWLVKNRFDISSAIKNLSATSVVDSDSDHPVVSTAPNDTNERVPDRTSHPNEAKICDSDNVDSLTQSLKEINPHCLTYSTSAETLRERVNDDQSLSISDFDSEEIDDDRATSVRNENAVDFKDNVNNDSLPSELTADGIDRTTCRDSICVATDTDEVASVNKPIGESASPSKEAHDPTLGAETVPKLADGDQCDRIGVRNRNAAEFDKRREDYVSKPEFQSLLEIQDGNFQDHLAKFKADLFRHQNIRELFTAQNNRSNVTSGGTMRPDRSVMTDNVLDDAALHHRISDGYKPVRLIRVRSDSDNTNIRSNGGLRANNISGLTSIDDNDASVISHSSAEGLVIRQSAEKENTPMSCSDLSDVSRVLATAGSENRYNTTYSFSDDSRCRENRENSDEDTLRNVQSPESTCSDGGALEGAKSVTFAPEVIRKDSEKLPFFLLHFDWSKLSDYDGQATSRGNLHPGRQLQPLQKNVNDVIEVVRANHDRVFTSTERKAGRVNYLRVPELPSDVKRCRESRKHSRPRLVPPHLIISYERQKLLEDEKLCSSDVHEQSRAYNPAKPNFMHIETEPWQPEHEKDTISRQKRRQKSHVESNTKSMQTTVPSTSCEFTQTDKVCESGGGIAKGSVNAGVQTSPLRDFLYVCDVDEFHSALNRVDPNDGRKALSREIGIRNEDGRSYIRDRMEASSGLMAKQAADDSVMREIGIQTVDSHPCLHPETIRSDTMRISRNKVETEKSVACLEVSEVETENGDLAEFGVPKKNSEPDMKDATEAVADSRTIIKSKEEETGVSVPESCAEIGIQTFDSHSDALWKNHLEPSHRNVAKALRSNVGVQTELANDGEEAYYDDQKTCVSAETQTNFGSLSFGREDDLVQCIDSENAKADKFRSVRHSSDSDILLPKKQTIDDSKFDLNQEYTSDSLQQDDKLLDTDSRISCMRSKLKVLQRFSDDIQSGFKSTRMLLQTIESLSSDVIPSVKESYGNLESKTRRISFKPAVGLLTEEHQEKLSWNDEESVVSSISPDGSSVTADLSDPLHVSGLSGLSDIMSELLNDPKIVQESGFDKLKLTERGKTDRSYSYVTNARGKSGSHVGASRMQKVQQIVKNQRQREINRHERQRQNFEKRKTDAIELIDDITKNNEDVAFRIRDRTKANLIQRNNVGPTKDSLYQFATKKKGNLRKNIPTSYVVGQLFQ
ncbi:Uncharacterised protein g4484 [Pycnogonum litorale]